MRCLVADKPLEDEVNEPENRIYTFRLHRSGRPWAKNVNEVDWSSTQVGSPVVFRAVQFGRSAWFTRGPVSATAPEDLEAPAWTVWTADELTDAPIFVGEVGHRLAEGETFDLPLTGVVNGGVPRRSSGQGSA